MTAYYLGDFGWSDYRAVCKDFNVSPDTLKGCRVFVACYLDTDYSGSAWVLYAKRENPV